MNESQNPPSPTPDAAAAPLTAEQIKQLCAQAAQAGEHYDRLLRLTADFDNFKKRAARERDETRRAAMEGVLTKFLAVLDNFDMALAATEQTNASVETLKVGIAMIHSQLRQVFGDSGVETIDAVGQSFDPAVHEAVSQKETTEAPDGQVIQQLRKGYRLRDKLLRPASVVVAKNPAANPAQS
jgi:molecular chaperone GrpE